MAEYVTPFTRPVNVAERGAEGAVGLTLIGETLGKPAGAVSETIYGAKFVKGEGVGLCVKLTTSVLGVLGVPLVIELITAAAGGP
jgi:hypothetical protein